MERGATWFCPNCWSEISLGIKTCPNCSADLSSLDQADYESKLIAALEHRMADRRLVAARVLGEIRATEAVPALIKLAERDNDPYSSAEAVRALARIGGAEATAYLHRAADHRSAVVRHAARRAMAK